MAGGGERSKTKELLWAGALAIGALAVGSWIVT